MAALGRVVMSKRERVIALERHGNGLIGTGKGKAAAKALRNLARRESGLSLFHLALLVAAVALAFLDLLLRLLAPVSGKRAPYVILRFGELAFLSADVTLGALCRLDQFSRHGFLLRIVRSF